MKKILLLAVLITGCCLTANAQMSIDRALQARAVSIAKKQMAAEEAAKQEDLVMVFINDGALSKVVRDGKVEIYSSSKKEALKNKERYAPYYYPSLVSDAEKEWLQNVEKFALLQQQLEEEKFELLHSLPSSKEEVLMIYRRKISTVKK